MACGDAGGMDGAIVGLTEGRELSGEADAGAPGGAVQAPNASTASVARPASLARPARR